MDAGGADAAGADALAPDAADPDAGPAADAMPGGDAPGPQDALTFPDSTTVVRPPMPRTPQGIEDDCGCTAARGRSGAPLGLLLGLLFWLRPRRASPASAVKR
jgi:hypothetical protein